MTEAEKRISKSKPKVAYTLQLEPELKEAAQYAAFHYGMSFNAWVKRAIKRELGWEVEDDN